MGKVKTAPKTLSGEGRWQYDPRRGVFYLFVNDETKSDLCFLRIEGLRDVPAGTQIEIHLVEPGSEHHHHNCGNRALLNKDASKDPGSFCAVKIEAPHDSRLDEARCPCPDCQAKRRARGEGAGA